MRLSSSHILQTIFGALALSLAFGTQSSAALEALKVYRGVLILEGNIVRGDYDKLRAFLSTKSTFDKISAGVFLASPGGDVVEAMKIGRLIRALRLSTDAPSGAPLGAPKFGESPIRPDHLVNPRINYLCTSACFFLYVSGIYRNLNWIGRLGIHRPIRAERITKTLSSDEELNLTWLVRNTIKKYLEDMDVSDRYVDLIYSIPPNEIRWITQSEFDSDFRGFIPELKDWLGDKCEPRSGDNRLNTVGPATMAPPLGSPETAENRKLFSARTNQSSETIKCWMGARTELSKEAWRKVYAGK